MKQHICGACNKKVSDEVHFYFLIAPKKSKHSDYELCLECYLKAVRALELI